MTEVHYNDETGSGSDSKAHWFYARSLGLFLVLLPGVDGWRDPACRDAVMDDFGNLVKVA